MEPDKSISNLEDALFRAQKRDARGRIKLATKIYFKNIDGIDQKTTKYELYKIAKMAILAADIFFNEMDQQTPPGKDD